jgi:hypothetical protein
MDNLHSLALSLKATDWAIVASAVATAVVAVFAIVLACVGRRQIADTRILQRAYLSVEPRGIEWTTNGSLVPHSTLARLAIEHLQAHPHLLAEAAADPLVQILTLTHRRRTADPKRELGLEPNPRDVRRMRFDEYRDDRGSCSRPCGN